jgi:hypothetical protein
MESIFYAWNTGRALHEEILASVQGFWTTEVYRAEICPLGNTGRVTPLLWLPDQQLVLDSGWGTIPCAPARSR